ncbi:hypothetical protein ABT352_38645 [Streptosporangium sp. NPDC000563]|uniref:hypothetical protein n=1 Tax=Streptosporangium sp. NPDC000563 TaxID=3154366 RepID=UPI00332E31F8
MRPLLVTLAVLLGVIAALFIGFLAKMGGAETHAAVSKGGVAFAGTVTLALAIIASLGLF